MSVPSMGGEKPPRRHRVLIVVSSYAPTMIADMQRARQLAWELPKLGWDVQILTPDQSYQPASCIDEDSAGFFPPGGKVRFVSLFLPRFFQWLGMRTIGWRALLPMFREGNRILSDGVDVVYFSTTQFCLFLLGPLWRARFGVPYVLDFHDPCVKEGDGLPVWATRNFRHTISRRLMKTIESVSVHRAAALVSVSPRYVDLLKERYATRGAEWVKTNTAAVIPFGVLDHDLSEACSQSLSRTSSDGKKARIIYIGAGGPIMRRSFDLLCRVLAALRVADPDLVAATRFEFYGTVLGWREGDSRYFADIAKQSGLDDVIDEMPSRVSYRRSLQLLAESSGALILGVDEAGYMPSKLYPYASSGKPLLSVLRREGAAYAAFCSTSFFGHALWFDGASEISVSEAVATVRLFLEEVVANLRFDRSAAVRPFTAPEMAARHVELFERVLTARSTRTGVLSTDVPISA